MKTVEIKMTQAYRSLVVGEVVRVNKKQAETLIAQGRAESVGALEPASVVPVPALEPPAKLEIIAKPPRRRSAKKAKDDAEPKKGTYSRRDVRAKP